MSNDLDLDFLDARILLHDLTESALKGLRRKTASKTAVHPSDTLPIVIRCESVHRIRTDSAFHRFVRNFLYPIALVPQTTCVANNIKYVQPRKTVL